MTPEMLATLIEQVAELVQTYSNNYPQFQRATYGIMFHRLGVPMLF